MSGFDSKRQASLDTLDHMQYQGRPSRPDELAQPQAGPVAWTWDTDGTGGEMKGCYEAHFQFKKPYPDKRILNLTPLYATPQAQPAPVPAWLPIESAPKHAEVLVWREDSGSFIAKLTTPEAVVSVEDMEREGLDYPDDFEEWWSDAYGWQEGSEKPTHWMPLPPAPGSAHAAPAAPVSNLVESHLIRTVPAAQVVLRQPNLFASAPAAPAVQPLTDERIDEIWDGTFESADPKRQLSFRQTITRAIERAHGITQGGKHG